jgi:hypothetical protein
MPIDDRKGLRDAAIQEMTTGDGLAVYPILITISHGYNAETGEDFIGFGSHDHDTKHLITQVMPLSLAREASQELARQIALVDRLIAARTSVTKEN